MNRIGEKRTALSKSWFEGKKKKDKEVLKTLNNNISNYFKHKLRASSDTIGWSTFKDYKSSSTDNGRKYVRALTSEENKNKSELPPELECFIPCNCRATNAYAERYNLAYMINWFVNPYIVKFFKQREIEIDQDQYALCEMLQWIWRSRIRNMESIEIYIPSKRMRELLISWMDEYSIKECSAFQNPEKVA